MVRFLNTSNKINTSTLLTYMKKALIFSFVFLGLSSYAQTFDIVKEEAKLFDLLETLRSADNDADKSSSNNAFKSALASVLTHEESFSHPFTLLSSVGFIDSQDKLVRIINWNVEQSDKSQRYYGFVQHMDKRGKELNVTELVEDVYGIKQPDDIVDAASWYGALYYKIIPIKKGSRTIYTVLGWDGNTAMSNIKLIDAMYINGRSVKFGSPVFKIGKETKKRLFYEHSEKVTMVLSYETDRKRIMMDHLSPESPTMIGYYSFYVPDLSYDAFEFEDSKWVLKEDVIGVNSHESQEKREIITKDPKTGKLVKKKIDNKWQDPSDANTPAGGNEHVAVTPEGQETKTVKDRDPKNTEPAVDKRDKRTPSESSIFGDMNKKKKRRRKKN